MRGEMIRWEWRKEGGKKRNKRLTSCVTLGCVNVKRGLGMSNICELCTRTTYGVSKYDCKNRCTHTHRYTNTQRDRHPTSVSCALAPCRVSQSTTTKTGAHLQADLHTLKETDIQHLRVHSFIPTFNSFSMDSYFLRTVNQTRGSKFQISTRGAQNSFRILTVTWSVSTPPPLPILQPYASTHLH